MSDNTIGIAIILFILSCLIGLYTAKIHRSRTGIPYSEKSISLYNTFEKSLFRLGIVIFIFALVFALVSLYKTVF